MNENEPFDQLEMPEQPRPKMPLGKVVLINFGILLAGMLLGSAAVGTSSQEAGLGVLMLDMLLVILQVGINMLVGLILVFTQQHKQLGSAMLISGLIMAAVGFGSCIMHAAILES